jgi:S-formylglutathione hydrolase FrmB
MGAHATAGRWQEISFKSAVLEGNPLGDPHVRPLYVYLPPGYDEEPELRWPSVYVIQGMIGRVEAWFNVQPFAKNFPQLVDELAPPCVVVLVDAFTALGGSQFLDSPAVGRYHTYLCDEIVPYVDANFRTLTAREHRGIQGKSSGGYGAMITPMLRPDLFGALATHAGDALFEASYLREFAPAARALREKHAGSWERFWENFRSGRPVFSDGDDAILLNTYAMAACYSANEDGSIDFPFDTRTGRLVPEVWDRWLEWDPVRRAPRHAETLRELRGVWIDSGKDDEYFLDLGATAFRDALEEIGVAEVRFELFPGRHGNITHRYPLSLAYLAETLAP